jgi:hypothetical protein
MKNLSDCITPNLTKSIFTHVPLDLIGAPNLLVLFPDVIDSVYHSSL